MRTMKEACLRLHEWTDPFTVASALEMWIDADNAPYLHSTLGSKSPRQFERDYHLAFFAQPLYVIIALLFLSHVFRELREKRIVWRSPDSSIRFHVASSSIECSPRRPA
jgi:hypothetical protein